jgi:riboflavin synthase
MFSGIIEGVGTLRSIEPSGDGRRLAIAVPASFLDLEPGASVAVNGACLTVVEREKKSLVFDAVGATLKRTLLGTLTPGARVNLERSLRLGGSVDGHLVTGHVDGWGTVTDRREGEGAIYVDVRVPADLVSQIAVRGSVAIDGVSLTVAGVSGDVFTVSLVPYTLECTTLDEVAPGRRVHLETDILAKYVQTAVAAPGTTPGTPGPPSDTETVHEHR